MSLELRGNVFFTTGKLMAGCLQLNVLLASQNQYISGQAHPLPQNQLQDLCPFLVKQHHAEAEALPDVSCQALLGFATSPALVRG